MRKFSVEGNAELRSSSCRGELFLPFLPFEKMSPPSLPRFLVKSLFILAIWWSAEHVYETYEKNILRLDGIDLNFSIPVENEKSRTV